VVCFGSKWTKRLISTGDLFAPVSCLVCRSHLVHHHHAHLEHNMMMNPVRTRAASFDPGRTPPGRSGSWSAIPDRLDQVKGINKCTLIRLSLVSLMHHDPSGLRTIPFWLHSLGMIRIRINDPRSLGSNQRNQWIHSGPFGYFDAPWSKWSWDCSRLVAFPWNDLG